MPLAWKFQNFLIMKSRPTFIDLFAGAGGLSEGFTRAGFLPIAHVEMDKDACDTIKTRTAYYYLKDKKEFKFYIEYLKGRIERKALYEKIPKELLESIIYDEISTKSIKGIFDKINRKLNYYKRNEIDVVIGGPPCQAYSNIGRSVHENGMENDDRNYLYKMYGRFLKEYNPKFFVFENVPGIKSAKGGSVLKNLKKYFRRIGYELEGKILNASHFGVLQNRRRMILIGSRKDISFIYPNFEKIEFNATISDLFKDLKAVRPGEIVKHAKYKYKTNEYLTQFEIRNGLDFYTQHITRPHNENDLEIYHLAINKWNNERVRLKYNDIPKKNRTQQNLEAFLDRFKVINNDGFSHTLVAHISKDGHYYIHPDEAQLRSISVREAARIQSFPDDYFFEGSRTSIFKQIGNAVPPLMAYNIANKLKLSL